MERIDQLLKQQGLSASTCNIIGENDRLQYEINIYNDLDGDMNLTDGIECSVCKNKGYIAFDKSGYKSLRQCTCMVQRRNKFILEKSGMAVLTKKCTLDSFDTKEAWQMSTKKKAYDYTKTYDKGLWFYIGGQVGSGKTHICVAISGYLMAKGIEVKYMLWRDEITKLKRDQYDDGEAYENRLWKLENVPVLYIDDFFKSDSRPSKAEIDIAFEIINTRCNNAKPTIISSEYCINGIVEIDEAIGSRIIQMAGEYCINIGKDGNKNIRYGGN